MTKLRTRTQKGQVLVSKSANPSVSDVGLLTSEGGSLSIGSMGRLSCSSGPMDVRPARLSRPSRFHGHFHFIYIDPMPATRPIRSYPVRIEGEDVLVGIGDGDPPLD